MAVLSIALLPAVALAQAPVAHWMATAEQSTAFPNTAVSGMPGKLNNVDILWKVEDLIDHPSGWFNGQDSYVEVANSPVLNPEKLTLSVWFKLPEGIAFDQKPLVLKSAPAHEGAMYQYGLFVADNEDYPKTLCFYLGIDGALVSLVATDTPIRAGWNRATATYDGQGMRLYCNGEPVGDALAVSGGLDAYDTPVLFGAYGNLEKTSAYSFEGFISEVVLHDVALSAEQIAWSFEEEYSAYPQAGEAGGGSGYAKRLDTVLREGRDVWGEALIAQGGATYDTIKDSIRPLYYSTGHTNTALGVHNLLFGEKGGKPPYIIPLADGSRIAANVYQSEEYLAWRVGEEVYGDDLRRLEGPYLADDFLPVLQTTYTDLMGNRFAQECFAGHVPGHEGVVAFLKMEAAILPDNAGAMLTLNFGGTAKERFHYAASTSIAVRGEGPASISWEVAPGEHTLYALWSPESALSTAVPVSEAMYQQARADSVVDWMGQLDPVMRFDVPETHVMNAQRNLLLQNLIMHWRYSLGSVVYHNSFYQPESSHAVQTLGEFGDLEGYRDGLGALLDMTKGEGYYINWERGEKLTHSAHYYHLTKDAAFIEAHTDAFVEICEIFRKQMAEDEYGLLLKQRQCGDIPEVAHFIFHQTVGWRGMRDMAEIWRTIGRDDLYAQYRPLADELKAAIDKGMAESITDMDDGSLFVARALHSDEAPYDAITETRIGSYWNLVMPYGFASGYWPMDGPELGRIIDYMHGHGGMLLGLLRFNYYPTPIGAFRRDGLPGYYTTGFDNVYLPAYIQMIAAQDLADRQVLSFYGKLAHGMTRNTFVTGEGATLGARPSEYYRSTYGGPTTGNNVGFLLNLRLMLVRESFDHDTGVPEGLFLAHATPREWLEHGKQIAVDAAPTCFGPVSYRIDSDLAEGRVSVHVTLPGRSPMAETKFKLRLPDPYQIVQVVADDGRPIAFDGQAGIIDLTGRTGEFELRVTTSTPSILGKDFVSEY